MVFELFAYLTRFRLAYFNDRSCNVCVFKTLSVVCKTLRVGWGGVCIVFKVFRGGPCFSLKMRFVTGLSEELASFLVKSVVRMGHAIGVKLDSLVSHKKWRQDKDVMGTEVGLPSFS